MKKNEKKTNLKIPVILSFIIGLIPLLIHLTGYGSYWYYGWPVFALTGFLILIIYISYGVKSFRKRKTTLFSLLSGVMLLIIIPVLMNYTGDYTRKLYCRNICDRAEPVFDALHDYYLNNGYYPEHLDDIPDFDNIRKNLGLSIQEGVYKREGLDVDNINNAEITIYLSGDDIYGVVPIQKRCTFTKTKFSIYAKKAKNDKWQYNNLTTYSYITNM
jgi:hypothetical protein